MIKPQKTEDKAATGRILGRYLGTAKRSYLSKPYSKRHAIQDIGHLKFMLSAS